MRIVIGMPQPVAAIVEDIEDCGYEAHDAPTGRDAGLAQIEEELGQIVLVDVADEAEAEALVEELGDAVWRHLPEAP